MKTEPLKSAETDVHDVPMEKFEEGAQSDASQLRKKKVKHAKDPIRTNQKDLDGVRMRMT